MECQGGCLYSRQYISKILNAAPLRCGFLRCMILFITKNENSCLKRNLQAGVFVVYAVVFVICMIDFKQAIEQAGREQIECRHISRSRRKQA